jgi:hypothetical protein
LSTSEKLSITSSIVILVSIVWVVLRQTWIVHQNTSDEDYFIMEDNEETSSYFDNLRTSRKLALLYQTFQFMRKLSFSLIMVFLKDFPSTQVFAMLGV